jgi:hypothetical protein
MVTGEERRDAHFDYAQCPKNEDAESVGGEFEIDAGYGMPDSG